MPHSEEEGSKRYAMTLVTRDGGMIILRSENRDPEWTAPISIGSDLVLGIRTLVNPGVWIGNGAIMGAGSIVTRDSSYNGVTAGVSARVRKSVAEYLVGMMKKYLRCAHVKELEMAKVLKRTLGVTTGGSILR